MKKFCYEIVYIGKILEVCSIKMAKIIDQLDTVVNEYNDIVKDITNEKNFARISGFAWGLGYVGTVIIFIIYYGLFFYLPNLLLILI